MNDSIGRYQHWSIDTTVDFKQMETIFRTGKKESFDRQMKNRGQCLATFSSRSQLIDGSEQSIIQPKIKNEST